MALQYDPKQKIYADDQFSGGPPETRSEDPRNPTYDGSERMYAHGGGAKKEKQGMFGRGIVGSVVDKAAPQQTGLHSNLEGAKGVDDFLDRRGTVAGQVDTNLQKGSPLIRSAQADSMKFMNDRGGLNSTMAASAGTKAAIDSVMPIAQQDAQTYADYGMENLKTDNQGRINNQAADLQDQQYESNVKRTMDIADNEAENARETYELTGQIAKDFAEFTNKFDVELANLNIDAAERKNIQAAISNQTTTMMNNIGQLLNNPDIEMGENIPSWMSDWMYKSWETTASLYGIDIEVV